MSPEQSSHQPKDKGKNLGESASSSPVPFDKLSIQEELYETDPKAAKKKILESLELDQVTLRGELGKLEVPEGIIDKVYKSSEKYAKKVIRAEELTQEHPKFEDVALDALKGAKDRHIRKLNSSIEEAKELYPISNKKREDISTVLELFSRRIYQYRVFDSTRNEDLEDLMSSFANIAESPKWVETPTQPSTLPLRLDFSGVTTTHSGPSDPINL